MTARLRFAHSAATGGAVVLLSRHSELEPRRVLLEDARSKRSFKRGSSRRKPSDIASRMLSATYTSDRGLSGDAMRLLRLPTSVMRRSPHQPSRCSISRLDSMKPFSICACIHTLESSASDDALNTLILAPKASCSTITACASCI
ncbi:hypothetical protein F444_01941 [Phytophthora nicotianae P1976]|uniref:Uncharacterized protein n=1 Tax=Phytophthora nicotianae P1976 TaxID=1317066 RepID=A0A081AZ14_PHYNI|nr:hypothetical protein F444_01941 [Phytophthora nicotianae P1976]